MQLTLFTVTHSVINVIQKEDHAATHELNILSLIFP